VQSEAKAHHEKARQGQDVHAEENILGEHQELPVGRI